MADTKPFELKGADGKLIRGDRLDGEGRRILFITCFLSKRWGNKSRALAQWCGERTRGFCGSNFHGNGDSDPPWVVGWPGSAVMKRIKAWLSKA